jgi:hypothetical protein
MLVCVWPCVRGLNRRCKHGGRISPAGLARHGAGPELGVRSSHEGDFRAGPDDAGGRLHGEEPRRRSGAAAGGRGRCLGAESVTPRMDDPRERRHRVSDARTLRRKQCQSTRRTVSCWSSRPSACSASGARRSHPGGKQQCVAANGRQDAHSAPRMHTTCQRAVRAMNQTSRGCSPARMCAFWSARRDDEEARRLRRPSVGSLLQ